MLAPTEPSPAASRLLGFLNTRADGAGAVERFADAELFHAWAIEHAPAAGADEVTEADLHAARQLRDALVALSLVHSRDTAVTPEEIRAAEALLESWAPRYPIRAFVRVDGVELSSLQNGFPGLLGSVLAAVADLSLAGRWPRLKACLNERCQKSFYDRSRNSSAAYCSSGCSSQAAMRTLRQRQREQPSKRASAE